ncbi:MAG TPA: hypothetical protein VKB88_27915 [Bryobacteraceae bacterium]|nr:hypothetical protein [Bryobacteraceae bacterium]
MNPSRQMHKLAELRAKTDRQLVNYLSAQLDRALELAATGRSLGRAERIYVEVRRLLPLAVNVGDAQWRSLLSRLHRLRHALDNYSVSCVA